MTARSRTLHKLSAALLLTAGTTFAADYHGNYEAPGLVVTLKAGDGQYTGEIMKGDQHFPLTAHEDGDHLTGKFSSGKDLFDFTATRAAGELSLKTAGAVYVLHRDDSASDDAPSVPTAAVSVPVASTPGSSSPVAAGDALSAYAVLHSTPTGQSLPRELPSVKTTLGAMRSVFPDLAEFFGARPTVLDAYEDQQQHQSSMVTFSASVNGKPVKGFVTAKKRAGGTVVFIVFDQTAASRQEWSALLAKPIANPNAALAKSSNQRGPQNEDEANAELMQKAGAVALTPYTFPDNTGAVGVAPGWTCNAQTESGAALTGPAGQIVRMALNGTIYTPDNTMIRQTNANNGKLAVAPADGDPGKALLNIVQANGVVNRNRGGSYYTPDRVVSAKQIPPRTQGHRAAIVTYDFTEHGQDGDKKMRGQVQFEYSPPQNGLWTYYYFYQIIAPTESFEQDKPAMIAQVFSLGENAAAVAAKSAREIAAANAHAQAMRDANQKIADAHYQQTADIERDEQIKMRSITDFDETIRGIRTVEDTQTGRQWSENLGDVHNVVDTLNYYDPGRYKEIPLRDEVFPMPGHENDPDYLAR